MICELFKDFYETISWPFKEHPFGEPEPLKPCKENEHVWEQCQPIDEPGYYRAVFECVMCEKEVLIKCDPGTRIKINHHAWML